MACLLRSSYLNVLSHIWLVVGIALFDAMVYKSITRNDTFVH